MSSPTVSFVPLVAATGQPVRIAMQRLWLNGEILPAGARLRVQHFFESDEPGPVEVIYAFPLPRDAAVRQFRVMGEHFEVHSELKQTEEAVKVYEEGIAAGHLSTLARQYGDGIMNLTVGNLQPHEKVTVEVEILAGVELHDDGFRFRFPFTLAPSYHAQARMSRTPTGAGELELPPKEFGDIILPAFHPDADALHQVGFTLSVISPEPLEEVASPSHPIRVKPAGTSTAVLLAAERDVPNRDLVLDGRYASPAPQVIAARGSDGKGQFAAVVPSTAFGAQPDTPRRVVILLDRSGSMQGEPIHQARKAIAACLAVLDEHDQFGLIAFDDLVDTFQTKLANGSRMQRDEARKWLEKVDSRGGTELAQGVAAAAKLLGKEGGDVFILTDGQVFGTEQILAQARATSVRLHCLGIGSASQDRFLSMLARETGGVSRFVTPRERVDMTAVDLFASVGRPVATGLTASPFVRPTPPGIVLSGTPVLLWGEAEGGSEAAIELEWNAGQLKLPLGFREDMGSETLRLLRGARLITDMESRYPSVEALAPLEQRKQNRISTQLRALSTEYGLASREMSLVAVVTRPGDRAGELPDTQVVPVGMPQGTTLRASLLVQSMAGMPAGQGGQFTQMFAAAPPPQPAAASNKVNMFSRMFAAGPHPPAASSSPGDFTSVFRLPPAAPQSPSVTSTTEDQLMDLASRLESDGGMPGRNPEERALSTMQALFAFRAAGHSASAGVFRQHMQRMMAFLGKLPGLPPHRQAVLQAVLLWVSKDKPVTGNWLAPSGPDPWTTLSQAVQP